MSYEEAMTVAGANVLAYEAFGSYQGTWYAKVEYEGAVGFVVGSYGSCSGCDAFQAEFGYDEPVCTEHEYNHYNGESETCADCKVAKTAYQAKLTAFGKGYLDNLLTYEQVLADAKKNADWDMESDKMVKWVEAHQ